MLSLRGSSFWSLEKTEAWSRCSLAVYSVGETVPLSATPGKWLLVVNPREAAVGQTLSLEGKPLGNLEPRSSKTQACPGPLCGLSWHSPHFLKVGNWASEDLSPLSSWISPRSLGGGRQRGRRRRGCHSLVEPDVLKMRGTRLPFLGGSRGYLRSFITLMQPCSHNTW